MTEPYIQIGNHVLTSAQAMAVRCAITDFHTQVSDPDYAKELGQIAEGYRARLDEVLAAMLQEAEVISPAAERDRAYDLYRKHQFSENRLRVALEEIEKHCNICGADILGHRWIATRARKALSE